MMTVTDVHDVFLRLYERALAEDERIARIERLHRTLERLGAPEDAIEIAFLRGCAIRDCRVNAPSMIA